MMNSSSCRPPAGKKLKRQVHPALSAPKKIGRKVKSGCFTFWKQPLKILKR
nr:MAG TPA: hypothetical protein [Caudoviricetes sp.]